MKEKTNPAIHHIYQEYKKHGRVSTDTRTIQKGDVFFALKGENFDGNLYVEKALSEGASLAVTERKDLRKNKNIVVVNNSLEALQELAKHHRRQFSGKVIGLTGSNGKTTTKELIYLVLNQKYKTKCTSGNLNNHIGVPLTILSSPTDLDFLIIEMGANAQGEIALLSSIADPDYGLITNIGKAHLEGFGGVQGVIKGKTELYKHLSKNRGKVFINRNNQLLVDNLPSDVEAIDYVEFKIINHKTQIDLSIKETLIHSQLYGKYNVENIIAAISIGNYFDVPMSSIAMAIKAYKAENNRSTVKQISKNRVFFDAYNANPSSMKESIKSFAEATKSPRMVIVGDMLELGEESELEHRAIIEFIKEFDFEKVYYIGPVFSALIKKNSFKDVAHLKKHQNLLNLQGWNILLKGSRMIKLETIFESENNQF